MIFGSVCSGIEAASVAWHPLGWKAAWLAEIEPFPSAVLAHHYPDTPNLGDMTKISARVLTGDVVAPDVLVGGTPCQAFSVAGLREGLNDGRGQLTIKYMELANAIDFIRQRRGEEPAVIVWENVPGVLSDKTNAFGCFLAGLAGESVELKPAGGKWSNAGCVFGPQRTVAWRVLDAQYFGVAQRRRRVFVVASARKGFDPATVLFEWDGVRRDTAPSREARQVAPTIPARSTAGGGLGTDFDCDGGTICVATGQAGAEIGADMAPTLNCNHEAPYVAHSLRGEGFDASEDGTGRGTPLVPCVVGAMSASGGTQKKHGFGWGQQDWENGYCVPVAFDTTQITSPKNVSNPKPWDACHPLAAGAHAPAIAFPANLSGTQCVSTEELAPSMGAANPTAVAAPVHAIQAGALRTNPLSGPDGVGVQADHAYTLEARAEVQAVQSAMQVRRLTPTEAERLQGFPDNYTRVPNWNGWRKLDSSETPDQCISEGLEVKLNKKTGKWRVKDVDGPRYKALGNSMATPCMFFIGSRIDAAVSAGKAAKKGCA